MQYFRLDLVIFFVQHLIWVLGLKILSFSSESYCCRLSNIRLDFLVWRPYFSVQDLYCCLSTQHWIWFLRLVFPLFHSECLLPCGIICSSMCCRGYCDLSIFFDFFALITELELRTLLCIHFPVIIGSSFAWTKENTNSSSCIPSSLMNTWKSLWCQWVYRIDCSNSSFHLISSFLI